MASISTVLRSGISSSPSTRIGTKFMTAPVVNYRPAKTSSEFFGGLRCNFSFHHVFLFIFNQGGKMANGRVASTLFRIGSRFQSPTGRIGAVRSLSTLSNNGRFPIKVYIRCDSFQCLSFLIKFFQRCRKSRRWRDRSTCRWNGR